MAPKVEPEYDFEDETLLEDDLDEEFDDEIVELAESIGKKKKEYKDLIKERKTMEMAQKHSMEKLINDHKNNLLDLRRKHAKEINNMEDEQSRERMERMKKNKAALNANVLAANESKLEVIHSSNKMYKMMDRKRKLEEDDEDIPECPICMQEMVAKQIYQCSEGHLVCSDCKPKVSNRGCATCRNAEGYISRCRYLENMIKKKTRTSYDEED